MQATQNAVTRTYEKRPYLIVGGGRLARHFSHYLNLLQIPHYNWSRQKDALENLRSLSAASDRVLLAVSDGALEGFVREHGYLLENRLVHFSGALSFGFAHSAHPANTFGLELYSDDIYKNTPFILETGRADFADVLPGLPNPYFYLRAEKKVLYHALCCFGANFTTMLWQNTLALFAQDLDLPASTLHPLMNQIIKNVQNTPATALTGPIVRGDLQTVSRHIEVLREPERKLYQAFLEYHESRGPK